MNMPESAFDRAVASSVETLNVPPFPAVGIRSGMARRKPWGHSFPLSGRFAAAAALLACSAGLAYGMPKLLHAIHFMVGNAKFEIISPGSVSVGEREMYAERSFHVRLPVGWPAGTQQGMVWRMGSPAAHAYIIQYFGAGENANANAVVFLEKADLGKESRSAISFRKKNGGSIGTSWTAGDERITLLSHHFTQQELQRIQRATR
ncbi:MAG: hypothetical protein DLM50_03710 [Candidatus Meridianibacter frigidus]|nr:MAG: hypothetical protein DLM50_03710 [Candidatus Eremiobacteraeota bacterium]